MPEPVTPSTPEEFRLATVAVARLFREAIAPVASTLLALVEALDAAREPSPEDRKRLDQRGAE